MAASYPGSIKSYPAINPGDTILDTDVESAYDEITAIETALLNGLAHDLKFTDATYDIGKSGATRPRDLFLSRNAVIGGTLAVTGVATFTAAPVFSAGIGSVSTLSASTIQFPATQVPSADVNALDDYEENDWTPVFGGAGGTSGQSYTGRVAKYVKVGRLVFCSCYFVLTTKGTITGNLQLQGLPFANWAGVSAVAPSGYFSGAGSNQLLIGGFIGSGATTVLMYNADAAAGGVGVMTTADVADGMEFAMQFCYFAGA